MFEKETDYKGYFLLLIILGGPAWIIYHSIEKGYPGMLDAICGCMIITAGVALWAHWQGDEPDAKVRQPALVMMVALAICGAMQVWFHVSLGRDISTAEDAEAAYVNAAKFESQMADQEAQRQIELAKARTEEAKAAAQQVAAETRRLNALPASQRGNLAARSKWSKSGNELPPPGFGEEHRPEAKAEAKPLERPSETAAQVRAGKRAWAIGLVMLEMLVAIGGSAFVYARKRWDINENGIPDWIERVYARNPSLVQKRWPEIYTFLSGQPGKATA